MPLVCAAMIWMLRWRSWCNRAGPVLEGEGGHAKDGAHGGTHDFGVIDFDGSAGEKDAFASSGLGCSHDDAPSCRGRRRGRG